MQLHLQRPRVSRHVRWVVRRIRGVIRVRMYGILLSDPTAKKNIIEYTELPIRNRTNQTEFLSQHSVTALSVECHAHADETRHVTRLVTRTVC